MSLYFYNFSTNFYAFSKFTDFDSIVHVTFTFYPLDLLFLLTRGPWPENRVGAVGFGRIPARMFTGGKGKVGEGLEEVGPHLLVASARREVVG